MRTNSHRFDSKQFLRFVAVGVVNTAISYGIYSGLVYLGMNYAIANLTALLIGIGVSFKTQGAIVFGNSERRRIFRYVLVWGGIYLLNVMLISRFIALGFNPYVSGALAIPVVTVLSYLSQKFFVFTARRPDAKP